MNNIRHIVAQVNKRSLAHKARIKPGDEIIAVNGETIEDIFDYQFLTQNDYVEVLVKNKKGKERLCKIKKHEDADLGIIFENGLMDNYRSCHNKCIFCFIDQMPKGMRESLYFKDDDSRLSFLQGNYITLTNMSEKDVDRIIKYRLAPINISFQTTNPELRCKMLNNRFAGEALKKVDRIVEAGLEINGQIVLCKGVNDGEELTRTITDLYRYLPCLQSVSVVPVGLSKFREGLYPLEPFDKEDACKVIDEIEKWQKKAYEEFGLHFVHASDEWYILAGREMPEEERYDGYLQLENGVGMIRSMLVEFDEKMEDFEPTKQKAEKISIVTGRLAFPYIKMMADRVMNDYPYKEIQVIPITNNFFGELITVTGLLTGKDISEQLTGMELGDRAILPENVLKCDENIFLDDMKLETVEDILQVKFDVVKSNGYDFVDILFR